MHNTTAGTRYLRIINIKRGGGNERDADPDLSPDEAVQIIGGTLLTGQLTITFDLLAGAGRPRERDWLRLEINPQGAEPRELGP